MFTGLYDSAHGLVDNGLQLSEGHVTLAEMLQDSGYRTAGFFGGPYLHPTFGLGQGFGHYQSCMTRILDDLDQRRIRQQSQARRGDSHGDVTGPRTMDEVARWLPPADTGPVFVFVHLWDVHYDYIPPPEYLEMFDSGYTGKIDGTDVMDDPAIHKGMDPRDLRHLIARYDGEIRFTDDTLAGILATFEQRGRLDDTLIVVTADHGEEFFEHGFKGHQRTLFDEVVRVPLIVRWPGRVAPGTVVADQVRTIDLMPTLLAAARVAGLPELQGRDLGPLLAGDTLPAEPALCELLVNGQEMRALRTPEYKVFEPGGERAPIGVDLVADPGELVWLEEPGERLLGALRDLRSEVDRTVELEARIAAGVREAEPDAETLRRLEALGYVGGER